MEILKPFIILMLSVLILLGCGQQTLKDEGLETKEISDAATTTSTTESDVEAPTVSSVSPENGASNVSTTTSITITFNESISSSGHSIMTSGTSCGSGLSFDISTTNSFSSSSCLAWEGSPTFSDSYKTLTIKPKNALSNSTTYYVRVRSDGSSKIQDNSGNTMTETKTWSFTTEGAEGPPTINFVTPGDGATNVSTNTEVSFTFDRSISSMGTTETSERDCAVGNYQLSTSNVFSVGTCYPWSSGPTLSNNAKTLSLTPKNLLIPSTTYYVRVTNSGKDYKIKDYSGNAMTQEKTWSFTTEGVDEAPTVSSVSPENGASNVSTSTSITITFNESISSSGYSILIDGTSCGSGLSFDISTSSSFSSSSCSAWEGIPTFSDNNKTLTIKPKNTLSSNTTYHVRVRSDGSSEIKDSSGDPMTETKTWSFTTE